MRDVSSVPSGSFLAAPTKIFAPGFSSLASAGAKVTIGMPGGTTIFFSPSLYLRVSTWPSVEVTIASTLALVMVLLGCRSHGRKPSARPRSASGKIVTSSAFWLPSGSGSAATPMYLPFLMSASVACTTADTPPFGASFSLTSLPSRDLTT
jgi:hypothetical protein